MVQIKVEYLSIEVESKELMKGTRVITTLIYKTILFRDPGNQKWSRVRRSCRGEVRLGKSRAGS